MPILRGQRDRVREDLHGEHSGCYAYDHGNQYMTDGHHKYVWYTQTGREHLFNLDEDPNELHDIAREPNADEQLQPWREKLMACLKDRPEGFTDGKQLIAGREHGHIVPGYDPDRMFPFL